MHLDDLCIKWCFIIEVCFYLMLIIGFNLRKNFKAYYEFRVLYVFTFPSADHGPIGSGCDKSWYQSICFNDHLVMSFSVLLW